MGARRGDFQPVLRSQFRQLRAKIEDLLPGITSVAANLGVQFHDRLVQLGFGALLQNQFAVGQNLLDVRTQLARFRIDDLEFFFDTESENVIAGVLFPRHLRWHSRFLRACASGGNVGRTVFHWSIICEKRFRNSALFAIH